MPSSSKPARNRRRRKSRQHVRELVKITVFVQWIPYLWEAGIQANLIQQTRSAGGITVWAIQMNRMAWTQVITAGLANRLIGLTENRGTIKA